MPTKVILLHGLNNNLEAFLPLKKQLELDGCDCHMPILPNHGENRFEAFHLEGALDNLNQKLSPLCQGEYSVIAFSLGALYFTLWVQFFRPQLPKKIIFLSPAFYLRHGPAIKLMIKTLPLNFRIPSQTPQKLKRFSYLYLRDYKLLNEANQKVELLKVLNKLNSIILIDQWDEVIDAKKTTKELSSSSRQVHLIKRGYLKNRWPGKYHIIFHPDYFTSEEWERLLDLIKTHLRDEQA